MIKLLLSGALICTVGYGQNAYSAEGLDVLLKSSKKGEMDFSALKVQKQLVLDNPFLVQSYGSFKSANLRSVQVRNWFELVFDKKYAEAASQISEISPKVPSKVQRLFGATKTYLYWKLGLSHTFMNSWLNEAQENYLLGSDVGIALDQVAGKDISGWMIKEGIYFTEKQIEIIDTLVKKESTINYSVQALRNLRRGEKSLKWISFLKQDDPLRLKLADSVILSFAKENKLAEAARVLKEIYEPVLEKTDDVEKLSEYHLMLARLLYQAQAYDAAEEYYSLIPDSSRKFLQSRVESLWISMRKQDYPKIKGELKSLSLGLFDEKFLPEVYLVSAMANLQMCQFQEVDAAFKAFVRVNRKLAKDIIANLKTNEPKVIDDRDFFLNKLNKGVSIRTAELKKLEELTKLTKLNNTHWKNSIKSLKYQNEMAEVQVKKELLRKWKNREITLERSIKNMRFVKVEFLSTMRRLRSKLALMKNQDSVTTYNAAVSKTGQLRFPYDGVLFGDELFNITSDVKKLCLQGRK